MQPRHRRDRGRDPRRPRPRRPHQGRVPRRRRHPHGGRVHPRALRVEARHLPRRRGPADRRRPRPTPPPPPALETSPTPAGAPWQARRVAQQTHALPLAGARWVDHRLATRTDGSLGPVITDRLVALATAKYDPEAHQQREANATAASEVTLSHPHPTLYAGTSDLTATGDTPVLQGFYDLLCAIAHQLWLDGDTDPLGVRKIKAIALITTLATGQATHDAATVLGSVLGSPAVTKQASGKIRLYVLVDADDLDTDAEGGAAYAVGTIERLGAATMAKLRQWVGHHQVEILPVLNMHRRDAVDSHDPPEWMKQLVELRDGHCVFPRCTVPAKHCDKDHLVPYLPIDEGGPPGQTHPDALACLCRRHHRAKTARVWRYARTPEGHYLWHGPHDATYLVTDTGTHRL